MINEIRYNYLKRNNLSVKKNLSYLVRVLGRFGNIPKIDGIDIKLSNKEPFLFKIVPGDSIIIGASYLNNPIMSLIYLRYAIEWQIWFQANDCDKQTTLLYDLAALKVATLFSDLFPKEDKIKLNNEDTVLTNIIRDKKGSILELMADPNSLLQLETFHGCHYNSTHKLKGSLLELIDHLAKPSELLLMLGGDFRLNIDEDKLLNKYGCRSFPRPEAFTFASSTASSVSNYAYGKSEKARGILIKNSLSSGIIKASFDFSENLKTNLKNTLELDDDCHIIFSPSGTDSALQIAGITQIIAKKEIAHILVGSDETGSGVPSALKGQHFENNTALEFNVKKGERIKGFDQVTLIEVPFRDKKGHLRTSVQIDSEVLKAIQYCHENKKYTILHVIDQSKLGYNAPSQELINELERKDEFDIQIVVDASQFRLEPSDIKGYLRKGYLVTITGSKFFTGPPYSGALIIPDRYTNWNYFNDEKLPIGLSEYYNQADWPTNWGFSKGLSNGFNHGSHMRWNAAISEMKRYFRVPLLYRNLGIEMFCNYIEESIRESNHLEQLFEEEFESYQEVSDDIGLKNTRTIFPFFIKMDGKVLNESAVRNIYLMLNSDVSNLFPNATLEIRRIASQKCHIGQPVKVSHKSNDLSAVLRLSLGSRVISESWKDRDVSLFFSNLENQMDQIMTILRKIEIIVCHPDLLKEELNL